MRYDKLIMSISRALLLNACATVTPACKDNDTRGGPYVEGGPGNMAQQFHDYRILHHSNDITTSRLYLDDKLTILLGDASRDDDRWELLTNDPFPSRTTLPSSTHVTSASTIPSHNARSIPLRVDLEQDDQGRQGEVLAIQEDQCWVIDDVRYLGDSVHATADAFRQSIENC